jgi:ribonuclease P protein component
MKHILKAGEFADILSNGRKYRGKTISLHAIEGDTPRELAVGLIVPKKQAPKAVTRNYIRRVIYAFFQEGMDKNLKGAKIVVRVTDSLAGMNKKPMCRNIREELIFLASKAGIRA